MTVESTTILGRGGETVFLGPELVVKVTRDAEQPIYMYLHPEVFAEVISVDDAGIDGLVRYVMPRYVDQLGIDALEPGLLSLRRLWRYPANDQPDWRRRLVLHLAEQARNHQLDVPHSFIVSTALAIPNQRRSVAIHGDSTLANLVLDAQTQRLRWIDPCVRDYIPGDPHVDLGKMFQSCYQYERVLTGEVNDPMFDYDRAIRLAGVAGLTLNIGIYWMIIHIMRLLPYQDERVRKIYEKVLWSISEA